MTRTNPSDEIIRALLEAEDEDDLVKQVIHRDPDELDAQLRERLPATIKAKEDYLEGKCVRVTKPITNKLGQSFVFGEIKTRQGGKTMSTLMYLDPDRGWLPDKWVDLPEAQQPDEGDEYKEVFHRDVPEQRYIPFGTLVHATLREEDLIPAFLDAIEMVDPVEAMELRNNYTEEIERADPEFCWETLLDALNRHVPPYSYFGAHIGDASDFGVWPNLEEIDRTVEEKPEELQSVPEGQPLPRGSKYIALTDAHGSYVALLDGLTGAEIWRYD